MNIKEQLEPLLLKVQKPARYIGGELHSIVKDKSTVDFRIALGFPDTYEIGMSHLGLKILYDIINADPHCWAERVYTPWTDFEALMRQKGLPLYGLESLDPLSEFDVIGFSLQYELSYTNVLNMLDLSGLNPIAAERSEDDPVIIAGGPCASNPEPLADFIDLFQIGEGEEVMMEMIALYREMKADGSYTKKDFLRRAAQIPGIYVPSLYEVSYHDDGTIAAVTPKDGAPAKVTKRIIQDMSSVRYPSTFIVPYMETVHDRAVLEVMRGCIRGCRFCQAGFIYRPLRAKNPDVLCAQGKALCDSTGYDELSLSSLSTSDHPQVEQLLSRMIDYTDEKKIGLSLPSLRVDNFSEELLEKVSRIHKTGLTFAPEAGNQRMRNVINKGVDEDEIMNTCKIAFEGGYTSVKLYFMSSLPTETDEDVKDIGRLAQRIVDLYFSLEKRPRKMVSVSISVAVFVPKCDTPFQWVGQDDFETIKRKQQALLDTIRSRKISVAWHDVHTSVLEGVIARGDRRLGKAIYLAWKKGCRLDSWSECFDYDKWMEAIREAGLTVEFYASRTRDLDEILPWDHIDVGVSKNFLKHEWEKAQRAEVTKNCREQCAGCGASRLLDRKDGVCVE
ncbi:MAG TPA: TIGR03960 family B12-binding radical SAM protein [Candidatus Faecivivens stercoripullorum]|uniref:TIGR03960 family B12-binding radical SAM protein n=1 Tax=Candidatus Faecivivens stercoripullorum TaxID=2840805 RepID=A0A9D1H6B4_9FIRM|nr:TIGR03960 family B12-binding radical SAM protein [Candidatus Faecivivens stercoripullorum]